MTYTINTEAKTIQIQGPVVIGDLLDLLEDLNINEDEYKLIPWQEPVYIYKSYPTYPTYPIQDPFTISPLWVTTSSTQTYKQ